VVVLVTWFGYKGKTAVLSGFGLSNVSEFAFVIFTVALSMNIMNLQSASFGIATSLVTLIISSLIYKFATPIWRKLKFIKFFSTGEAKIGVDGLLDNHIIICGYGRVGKWIGRAFNEFNIPFVVIEYDKSIVNELRKSGIKVLYGDPSEPEVMEAVNIRSAKLLILAIPDGATQEALISYTQTYAPDVKIISRVHTDIDFAKLKNFQINKLVQPEFEASLAIIRSVLGATGRKKDEINMMLKRLRLSHNR
jgi:CPA2 family monovalent cation:H+ antiporter-2